MSKLIGTLTIAFTAIFFMGSLSGATTQMMRQGIDTTQNTVIVDTGQVKTYDTSGEIISPKSNRPFYGQDAHYNGNTPSYRDNGDGTVTDINTGLTWSQTVNKKKVSLTEAEWLAKRMTLGGHTDWRVPNIKELFSLIDFRGYTGSSRDGYRSVPSNAVPFMNTDYFDFRYGDIDSGERYIDAQWLSSTKYVSTTMNDMETLFGVNFADGRIKGYGYKRIGTNTDRKKFYVRFVRGNAYGSSQFIAHGNNTVTDQTTGLMWMQQDSGKPLNWQDALEFAENLVYGGYDDWRLPNAKELQYIVNYSRSPDTTNSPAIDAIFKTTAIKNEAGQKDFPYFWTSTTHLDGPRPGANAAYIAFGRALGKMRGEIMDVHGAGAQRSDPKTGRATSRGPQGDMIRVKNYVRCVRGGVAEQLTRSPKIDKTKYPYTIKIAQQPTSRKPQAAGPKGNTNPPMGNRGGFVRRLDRNGDNRISKSEFDGPRDRFDDHDTNHDGYLTEDEAPKGPPPGGGRPPRR